MSEPIPGLRAWQSAQILFPGTVCTSSASSFSLRACWRLLKAPDMVGGGLVGGRDWYASFRGVTSALHVGHPSHVLG